ncbi:MAG: HEAT repeat domain-containing protein, partial [Bacteroidota bacterium]
VIEKDAGKTWSAMDSLFIRASAAPLRYQSGVEPARKEMIAHGLEALTYCQEHFGTIMPRERLALEQIIPALHAVYPQEVELALMRACEDDSAEVSAFAMTQCGKLRIQSSIGSLLNVLEHDQWRLRSIAARQLGEFDVLPDTAIKILSRRLHDEQYMVRGSAAYAIGKLMPQQAVEILQTAFFEQLQIVRNNAIKGMEASKKITVPVLQHIFEGQQPEKVQQLLIGLLQHADTSVKAKDLASIMANTSSQRQKVMLEDAIKQAKTTESERAKETRILLHKSTKDPEI